MTFAYRQKEDNTTDCRPVLLEVRDANVDVLVVQSYCRSAVALLEPPPARREELQLDWEVVSLLQMFGDRLLPRLNESSYRFSYANRRRTEIARALASRSKLLLLDEPTAGMNATETQEMLQ
jgi:branched-chain amino acid transport system ATP-binding protein